MSHVLIPPRDGAESTGVHSLEARGNRLDGDAHGWRVGAGRDVNNTQDGM